MSGTKIKICGLFRECDAAFVNAALPDYAGFVFYEKSRRNVLPEQARHLRALIVPQIKTVGVFVKAPQSQIAALCREKTIDIVQLHGEEDNAYIARLREILPDTPVWAAYRIRTQSDIYTACESAADMVLLDNGYGTGKTFDWSLIGAISRPFILAGGLTPENIPQAISRFQPYAVDLSSGVETDGAKNCEKIYMAVTATRQLDFE